MKPGEVPITAQRGMKEEENMSTPEKDRRMDVLTAGQRHGWEHHSEKCGSENEVVVDYFKRRLARSESFGYERHGPAQVDTEEPSFPTIRTSVTSIYGRSVEMTKVRSSGR